jgi:hypothetical protein
MKRLSILILSVLFVVKIYAHVDIETVIELLEPQKVTNDAESIAATHYVVTKPALVAVAPMITDIVLDPYTGYLAKITILHNGSTTVYQSTNGLRADFKIWPTGSESWNWRAGRTCNHAVSTRHAPGIQVADVVDLIDDADIFILSQGVDGDLLVQELTVKYLEAKGKTVYCLPTIKESKIKGTIAKESAIDLYKKLANEGKRVAALIHATC